PAPPRGLRASAEVSAAASAAALAQSIRLFGHRGAHLDPLGSEPPGDPHLDYGAHGLTEDDLAHLPASIVGVAVGRAGLADAAAHGTRSILLGMAHRGRLNVLAHVLGKPYARILAEFEGREPTGRGTRSESVDAGWAGDVKYHAGARRAIQSPELRNGTDH